MKGRHFLSFSGWTAEDVLQVLDLAADLKLAGRSGRREPLLAGRTLALIFQKPSTRTRVSFEVAMTHLGGHSLFLSAADIQIGRGEPLADTARVLSGYVDAVAARVFGHQDVETLAKHSSVPVINALSDRHHPCQALADLLTLREVFGPRGRALRDLRLAYVGDGNNVANSLIEAAGLIGMPISVATPPGYSPDPQVVAAARSAGGTVVVTDAPAIAVAGADAVYTDVWASMGEEAEAEARRVAFRGYTVDEAMMARTAPGAIFLHCLPAHRGEEVAVSVIDGPRSEVFRQAENRLHTQKALLALLL